MEWWAENWQWVVYVVLPAAGALAAIIVKKTRTEKDDKVLGVLKDIYGRFFGKKQ